MLVMLDGECDERALMSIMNTPAPLSPVMSIDWLMLVSNMSLYAWSANAKMCGAMSPLFFP